MEMGSGGGVQARAGAEARLRSGGGSVVEAIVLQKVGIGCIGDMGVSRVAKCRSSFNA